MKEILNSMKKEGIVTGVLDKYLLSLSATDADRAIDVNAPSQMGNCLRSRYYARTGAEKDMASISARTRRIFDNGTYTHIRLQEYLKAQGILLMDEVPVINPKYNIQGHTDGILQKDEEKLILEIKSINSRGFSELIDAKPEHKMQGLIYAFCLEERRKYLKSKYRNNFYFRASLHSRVNEYTQYYQHLKDGHKHSRADKLQLQVDLHKKMDEILFNTNTPITRVVFLYENKDTQDLKEFVVDSSDPKNKEILEETLKDCAFLNECIRDKSIPMREGKNKSDNTCRWCEFKSTCWVV